MLAAGCWGKGDYRRAPPLLPPPEPPALALPPHPTLTSSKASPGSTLGSPRPGRGWLLTEPGAGRLRSWGGRRRLLSALRFQLLRLTGAEVGAGGKTKMGKKNPPDRIGNKTGHCWVAGKVLSAARRHRPARSRAALLCAGGQRGCVRLCPLCSRGQGEVFGEGDLPSGLAALVQEPELLFCQPVCPAGSP